MHSTAARVCHVLVALTTGISASAQDKANRISALSGTRQSGQRELDRYKIIYPPKFSKENKLTPVVFALHGFGGDMRGMASLWKEPCARMGAILVALQGNQVREAGGFAWSGPEDAGALIEVVRKKMQKELPLSPYAPRVLTGMSQGAFATWTLGLRYPVQYRRLIPVCGMFKPTSVELAQPLTEAEQKAMKRWRVYIMAGIHDRQELVSNNGWAASELRRIGAAVQAPFMEKTDPSWGMYQVIGHEFPGKGEERAEELTRALRFVLQPDSQDEKNWASVDPAWRSKAAWMQAEMPHETGK